VRVITFDDRFSKELCGGTHVQATGQIGFFKIVAESAVAAGVRRIEAITGHAAEQFVEEQLQTVAQVRELLNNPKDVASALNRLLEENSALRKEVDHAVNEKARQLKGQLINKVAEVNGVCVIAERVDLPNAEAVKTLAYALKDAVDNLFLVLGAEINGKPSITVVVSDNLIKERGWNAGAIIRDLAKEIKGGGGGQPFYATAGGKDVTGLPRALAKAADF